MMIKDYKLYPYGTSAGNVCKTELLKKYKFLILMIILTKLI